MLTKTRLERLINRKRTVIIIGEDLCPSESPRQYHNTNELLTIEKYQTHYWQQHDFIAQHLMKKMKPSPIHKWLANVSHHRNAKIIDLNVNSLVAKLSVKSEHLLKLHGDVRRFIDNERNEIKMSLNRYKAMRPESGDFNKIRPDIVFYGEEVKEFGKAISWIDQARVIVAMGTRLNSFPINHLALSAHQMEKLIIINDDCLNIQSTGNVKVNQINMPVNEWFETE